MTFDELLNDLETFKKQAGYKYHEDPNSAIDMEFKLNHIEESVKKLRETYAPTIEMTLNENQEKVLNYMEQIPYVPMDALKIFFGRYQYDGLPPEIENAMDNIIPKEQFEVLKAYTEWGLQNDLNRHESIISELHIPCALDSRLYAVCVGLA